MVRETMKLMRAMTMHRDTEGAAAAEVTRDNSIEFGAAELAGFNLQLNVTLQVGVRGGQAGRGGEAEAEAEASLGSPFRGPRQGHGRIWWQARRPTLTPPCPPPLLARLPGQPARLPAGRPQVSHHRLL